MSTECLQGKSRYIYRSVELQCTSSILRQTYFSSAAAVSSQQANCSNVLWERNETPGLEITPINNSIQLPHQVSEPRICLYLHQTYHVNQNICKEAKPPWQATWMEHHHQHRGLCGNTQLNSSRVKPKDEGFLDTTTACAHSQICLTDVKSQKHG